MNQSYKAAEIFELSEDKKVPELVLDIEVEYLDYYFLTDAAETLRLVPSYCYDEKTDTYNVPREEQIRSFDFVFERKYEEYTLRVQNNGDKKELTINIGNHVYVNNYNDDCSICYRTLDGIPMEDITLRQALKQHCISPVKRASK